MYLCSYQALESIPYLKCYTRNWATIEFIKRILSHRRDYSTKLLKVGRNLNQTRPSSLPSHSYSAIDEIVDPEGFDADRASNPTPSGSRPRPRPRQRAPTPEDEEVQPPSEGDDQDDAQAEAAPVMPALSEQGARKGKGKAKEVQ